MVNFQIRKNIALDENRAMSFDEARKTGAMALFGEKYGDKVRVIKFAESVELCGGTHVAATGQIGSFKIVSETAIAAGIRRIEAISGNGFMQYVHKNEEQISTLKEMLGNPQDLNKAMEKLLNEYAGLQKKIEQAQKQQLEITVQQLQNKVKSINGIEVIAEKIEVDSAQSLKDIAFRLRTYAESTYLVLGAVIDDKPTIAIAISDKLVETKKLNAGQIIREVAKLIDGGGGGQPFLATAGGKKAAGLSQAIEKSLTFI